MKIEVATLDDVPQISELGQLLHDTSSYAGIPYSRAKVDALMASLISGGGVVFVVRRDGQIMGGIAGGVTEHWFSDEKLGFEYSFFLHPEARGGFTALKIIAAFKTWCQLRGAKTVRMGITTGINEEGTAKLYRFAGFKDAGQLFKLEV